MFRRAEPGQRAEFRRGDPLLLHLGLVLAVGIALPGFLYDWFAHAAALLG